MEYFRRDVKVGAFVLVSLALLALAAINGCDGMVVDGGEVIIATHNAAWNFAPRVQRYSAALDQHYVMPLERARHEAQAAALVGARGRKAGDQVLYFVGHRTDDAERI